MSKSGLYSNFKLTKKVVAIELLRAATGLDIVGGEKVSGYDRMYFTGVLADGRRVKVTFEGQDLGKVYIFDQA